MADRDLPDPVLRAVSAALGVPLLPREPLRGGNRAVVQRMQRPDGTTVVVKAFLARGEEWAREWAALRSAPVGVNVPRPLAATADPPAIVMTDLGRGSSVADALLSDDPAHAHAAVLAWAETIALLHSATVDRRDEFRRALAQRDPSLTDDSMPETLDAAARDLAALADRLEVDLPPGALERLRGLLPEPEAMAMSPSDACPDNNVTTVDGLALLDFEGAHFRHVAWDVAYLAVPWPSCWCSWRLPERTAAAAIRSYRQHATLPYVRSARFDDDIIRAVVGWALASTTWFAERALGSDPAPEDPRLVTPTRRATILHRLSTAAAAGEVEPVLAESAARLRAELLRRWGEVPLAVAPAFRVSG